MRVFVKGLMTGLVLQTAIGPVFIFIINLALQRSVYDGLIAVLAVTIVDYFYISLAIIGIGKLLKNNKIKKIFGVISSILLIIFGIIVLKNIAGHNMPISAASSPVSILSSFIFVFILAISSPMTIVFFTSLFTAKAIEYKYKQKELFIFGFGTGLATLLFIGTSVIIFSIIGDCIPLALIRMLNLIVGCVLIGYGAIRLIKIYKYKF